MPEKRKPLLAFSSPCARFKFTPSALRATKNGMRSTGEKNVAMHHKISLEPPSASRLQDAANLLQALESLRDEIGSIADEIINILRKAGVTPAQEPKSH